MKITSKILIDAENDEHIRKQVIWELLRIGIKAEFFGRAIKLIRDEDIIFDDFPKKKYHKYLSKAILLFQYEIVNDMIAYFPDYQLDYEECLDIDLKMTKIIYVKCPEIITESFTSIFCNSFEQNKCDVVDFLIKIVENDRFQNILSIFTSHFYINEDIIKLDMIKNFLEKCPNCFDKVRDFEIFCENLDCVNLFRSYGYGKKLWFPKSFILQNIDYFVSASCDLYFEERIKIAFNNIGMTNDIVIPYDNYDNIDDYDNIEDNVIDNYVDYVDIYLIMVLASCANYRVDWNFLFTKKVCAADDFSKEYLLEKFETCIDECDDEIKDKIRTLFNKIID